jgi:hypothetical protein
LYCERTFGRRHQRCPRTAHTKILYGFGGAGKFIEIDNGVPNAGVVVATQPHGHSREVLETELVKLAAVILAMSTTSFSSASKGAEPAVAATRSITSLDVLRLIFCSLCDFPDDQSTSRLFGRMPKRPLPTCKGNCYFTGAIRLVHYILASEGFNLTIRFGLGRRGSETCKGNTIPADIAIKQKPGRMLNIGYHDFDLLPYKFLYCWIVWHFVSIVVDLETDVPKMCWQKNHPGSVEMDRESLV